MTGREPLVVPLGLPSASARLQYVSFRLPLGLLLDEVRARMEDYAGRKLPG